MNSFAAALSSKQRIMLSEGLLKSLRTALGVGGFIAFFLILFRPFGMEIAWLDPKLLQIRAPLAIDWAAISLTQPMMASSKGASAVSQ